MKLQNSLFVGLVLSLLVGCKTTPENKTFALIPINKSATYVFPKLSGEASNVVTRESVKGALVGHINQHAGYTHCGSLGCTKVPYPGNQSTWGKEISPFEENKIRVTYFMKDTFRHRGTYKTTLMTSFPYEISETDTQFKATLLPPTSAHLNEAVNPYFLPISAPLDEKELNTLVARVFNDKPVNIKSSITTNGEFDVDFDPASVQTNFERIFKGKRIEDNTKTNRAYQSRFNIYKNDIEANVEVAIYLYRGKSKVEYKVTHPVTVNGNGKSDYNPALMNNLIESIKQAARS